MIFFRYTTSNFFRIGWSNQNNFLCVKFKLNWISCILFAKSANSEAFWICPQSFFGGLSSCIPSKPFSCSLKWTRHILVCKPCSYSHPHLECLLHLSFSIQQRSTSLPPPRTLLAPEKSDLWDVYGILIWPLVNNYIAFYLILVVGWHLCLFKPWIVVLVWPLCHAPDMSSLVDTLSDIWLKSVATGVSEWFSCLSKTSLASDIVGFSPN